MAAAEKAEYVDLEVSRVSLEKTVDRMVEAFQSSPKSTIKRRLKSKAMKSIKWPQDLSALPLLK